MSLWESDLKCIEVHQIDTLRPQLSVIDPLELQMQKSKLTPTKFLIYLQAIIHIKKYRTDGKQCRSR